MHIKKQDLTRRYKLLKVIYCYEVIENELNIKHVKDLECKRHISYK